MTVGNRQPYGHCDPMSALPSKPVLRPKDAATLLIVRRDGPQPRVLMGRRSGGHAFMPDKWVFPGGRIHPSDFRVPTATELRPEVATALERGAPSSRARAIALAAIRETFEETGLLLARPGAPVASRGEWRDFLAAGALPDLGALDYVARAITPPARNRRFDARFFVADAEALIALEPGAGSGELGELAWFDWPAALALDLPNITRVILAQVRARFDDPGLPIPYHRFERGAHRLFDA